MIVQLFNCKYCKHNQESFKNRWLHENSCIYKPTFLDLHYKNTISNKLLKKDDYDIIYITNKKEIAPSYASYGNTVHIITYDSNKQIQIEYDLIFYNYKGLSRINIENIKVKNTDYSIEMLEYNLQNKDKLYILWITIKCRFAEYDWLLKLFEILPISVDLPDEINVKSYSQWLVDNGFKFEYKFGDSCLKF